MRPAAAEISGLRNREVQRVIKRSRRRAQTDDDDPGCVRGSVFDPCLVGLDELDFRDRVRWNEAKNVDRLDEPSLEND
jgi:hypothetical protein